MAKTQETLDITYMDAKDVAAELLRVAEIDPDARIEGGYDGLGDGAAWIVWSREMTAEEAEHEENMRQNAGKVLAKWEADFIKSYMGTA